MSLRSKLINQLYRWFIYPKVHRQMKKYKVCSVPETINNLINNNCSLSRFGDGEIAWIFMDNLGSFEKNSKSLSNRLLQVLTSKNSNLNVALPNIFFNNGKNYIYSAKRFYKAFMAKEGYKIFKYLKVNKQYYNTDISRIYTSSRYNKYTSKILFNKLKKIWHNKNVLIIEGYGTQFGMGNDLLDNALNIKRIECPLNNAFESYNSILKSSLEFLTKNKNYMAILSLGPTATVLAYDLSKYNIKALDLGHLDIEYEWYLRNVHKKVNIPYKYVNEVHNGSDVVSIKNDRYKKEIINYVS